VYQVSQALMVKDAAGKWTKVAAPATKIVQQ
jgi:hypothetical protein